MWKCNLVTPDGRSAEDGEQGQIVIRTDGGKGDRAQRVIDDVLKLSVPNASGEMVPFSSFTRVEEQLWHF